MENNSNIERLRDGRLDSLQGVQLKNCITILAGPKNGEVEAQCEHCGKVFLMTLNPIVPSAAERELPCGCIVEISRIEQACAQKADANISLIGQTISPDKHRRALCRCNRDGCYFRARMEAVLHGRVKSCGCRRTEQIQKNLSQKGKNVHVMGTRLPTIQRKDDHPISSNTSGYSGVVYDNARDKWVAELYFRGHHYYKRFPTKDEAILCREKLKCIHNDFLIWWESLTDEERTIVNSQHLDKKDVPWDLLWNQLDSCLQQTSKEAKPK